MQIYADPTWRLLQKCITENKTPMTRQMIIRWFEQIYPRIKSSTVAAHIISAVPTTPLVGTTPAGMMSYFASRMGVLQHMTS